MQKKTVIPTRTTRAEVETPPRRTEENDPFIRRLGDLWRAAKEHDQHETAQLVQEMLLTYKGLKKGATAVGLQERPTRRCVNLRLRISRARRISFRRMIYNLFTGVYAIHTFL